MKRILLALTLAFTLLGVANAQDDREEVTIWFHSSGASPIYEEQVARFNESQDQYRATITEIPGGAVSGSGYNDAVNAAAVAGDLPCILDLDGPFLYNYAWAGFLEPLDDYMPEGYMDDFLQSIVDQGTYNDQLYAIGPSDSATGLVSTRPILEEIGARIPTGLDDPWTWDEFNEYLTAIRDLDSTEYAIDTRMNFGAGEWYTYGFSPWLQSYGGDLIDRSDYQSAEGVLNSEESIEFMTWLQNLYQDGYSTLTPPDNFEFVNGNAGMGLFVNWMYNDYKDAFGDDLVVMPAPDLGEGAVSGMGSWAWAMSSQCENKEGAWALLEYLLEGEQIDEWTSQFGSMPARISLLDAQERWQEGSDMYVLRQQLEQGVGLPRPITPAYPTITAAYATAMDNIIKGGDVGAELDTAVDKIDQNIADNQGYPNVSEGQ